MNPSIGERLKSKRLELKLTVEKVSNELKIRPEFIKALEADDYTIFASDVYAKGFIKNYAKFLGLNSENFTAVYRRDIESTRLQTKKSKDTPLDSRSKRTFAFNRKSIRYFLFIILLTFVTFGLLKLLNKTFEPPYIELLTPMNIYANSSTAMDYYDKTVRITGRVNPNTAVKVNSITVGTKPDNTFESDLFPVTLEKNTFLVEAISSVGVVSRIELILNKKNNILEEAKGIYGIIQIVNDSANIKVITDNTEQANALFFVNDSIPVIAKSSIQIETDQPDNIKIFINEKEYKVLDEPLKLRLENDLLIED